MRHHDSVLCAGVNCSSAALAHMRCSVPKKASRVRDPSLCGRASRAVPVRRGEERRGVDRSGGEGRGAERRGVVWWGEERRGFLCAGKKS